jgi:hypothetical protein
MTAIGVGEQIGNYVLKQLLGKGGMGEVYLAEHTRIGRQVAIKVLSPAIAASPRAAERFEVEAAVISRIDHPNIVTLFDFGALPDGSLYYVMELLKGLELDRVLAARGRLPLGEVYHFLVQICRGLQAAHAKGIVHRDLKPQNLFVLDGPERQIKILDFGIAKVLEAEHPTTASATTTGMVLGTPLFISPEQAAGQSQLIGPPADIYSLGVTLYWMLCGEPPFAEKVPLLLLAQHIRDEPPPLRQKEPSVPPAVAEVVHRCLQKDPRNRPRFVGEVALSFATAIGLTPDPALAVEPLGLTLPPGLAQTSAVATGPTRLTTLSGTAGEMRRAAIAQRRWVLLVVSMLGVGALATAAYLGLRPTRGAHSSGADPTGTPREVPRAVSHTVHVVPVGVQAQCVLEEKRGRQAMSSPCRFEVQRGQMVRLTVSSRSGSFFKQWPVDSDVTLALVVDAAAKRLVLADQPGGPSRDAAPQEARPKEKRRLVKRRPPTEPASHPADAPAKKTPPPANKEAIGDDTIEVKL